jgi:hypothetical protein
MAHRRRPPAFRHEGCTIRHRSMEVASRCRKGTGAAYREGWSPAERKAKAVGGIILAGIVIIVTIVAAISHSSSPSDQTSALNNPLTNGSAYGSTSGGASSGGGASINTATHHVKPAAQHACGTRLWRHIYHPDRLKLIKHCLTVHGTVEGIRWEPDGDVHIQLTAKSSLINAANTQYEDGYLVLEEICQGNVTQADAVNACKGVPHNLTIPAVGDIIRVSGSYVLDQDHGWMEIHPVTSVTITGHVGSAQSSPSSAPPAAPPPAPVHHHHHASAGAWCNVSVHSFRDSDNDEWLNDVYVHSNQPNLDATASGGGDSWSYYTDSSGYADIYLNGPAPGTPITVTVGGATCSG